MAGSSLFTLIDDIATLLDDVALMTKVAAKKTAGVLGDDLALNAEQVSGVSAERELPVVWAVAKGSLRNKVILVPAALAISAFIPWAVIPLLMVGGAYLCFEGFEKIAHALFHTKQEDDVHLTELINAVIDPEVDMVTFEQEKIAGAIRTDFVLSAEIITITLGTVAGQPLISQVTVLAGIAFIMTIGVYGLVAGIVKMDDVGLYMSKRTAIGMVGNLVRGVGRRLFSAAPFLMKGLSIVGTAAMFMVGGGILTHGIPVLHHAIEQLAHGAHGLPYVGGVLGATVGTLLDATAGIVAGAAVLVLITLLNPLLKRLIKLLTHLRRKAP